jgi:hypothetical protein
VRWAIGQSYAAARFSGKTAQLILSLLWNGLLFGKKEIMGPLTSHAGS